MTEQSDSLSISFFSEIFMLDQLARNRLARCLPRGMEISHLSVLNHLATAQEERGPAQLAQVFHVTRGAMTNTLNKLEEAGYIHIRPDWEDARRKMVTISPAGERAREQAIAAVRPLLAQTLEEIGAEDIRRALPALRRLRHMLSDQR